jgi:hypothetical protein
MRTLIWRATSNATLAAIGDYILR